MLYCVETTEAVFQLIWQLRLGFDIEPSYSTACVFKVVCCNARSTVAAFPVFSAVLVTTQARSPSDVTSNTCCIMHIKVLTERPLTRLSWLHDDTSLDCYALDQGVCHCSSCGTTIRIKLDSCPMRNMVLVILKTLHAGELQCIDAQLYVGMGQSAVRLHCRPRVKQRAAQQGASA